MDIFQITNALDVTVEKLNALLAQVTTELEVLPNTCAFQARREQATTLRDHLSRARLTTLQSRTFARAIAGKHYPHDMSGL